MSSPRPTVKGLGARSRESFPAADAARDRYTRRRLTEMRAARQRKKRYLDGIIELSYVKAAAKALGLDEVDGEKWLAEWLGTGAAAAPLGNSGTSRRALFSAAPRWRSEGREAWWGSLVDAQGWSAYALAAGPRWRGTARVSLGCLRLLTEDEERAREDGARDVVKHLRAAVRPIQRREAVASCGDTVVGLVGVAPLREANGHAFTGLATCGSPWDCPVCAAKIRGRRAAEVTAAVELHRLHTAGTRCLVTLTMRHAEGMPLAQLRRQHQDALSIFRKRVRRHETLSRVFGLGDVTGREVTHGANGWHYHTHHITFASHRLEEWEISAAKAACAVVWRDSCVASGMSPECWPTLERGADVRRCNDAEEYVSKLGLEVSGSWAKRGHAGSRSPWQVAHDAADGCTESARLWWEYSAGMQGVPSVRVSPTLGEWLRRCGWKSAPDDAAAAADEVVGDLAVEIPLPAWRAIRATIDARQIWAALRLETPQAVRDELRRVTDPELWAVSEGWGDGSQVEAERRGIYPALERRAIRAADPESDAAKRERARLARERFRASHVQR